MERSEAEAVYDSGRERCVEVMLGLAGAVEEFRGRCERLEDRIRRLEEQSRQSSRNSSQPPSQDPPKTRAERRAQARKKAKAWARREGEKRKPGAQLGHEGSGRKLLPEDHRALGRCPPEPREPCRLSDTQPIQRRDRLGGIVHEYYRAAA